MGAGYPKLENLMFRLLGCRLSMRNTLMFLEFVFDLTQAMEVAKDLRVSVGFGRRNKMAGNQEIQMTTVDRVWVLKRAAAWSVLSLSDIEEATLSR